jgi:hypothetical protein
MTGAKFMSIQKVTISNPKGESMGKQSATGAEQSTKSEVPERDHDGLSGVWSAAQSAIWLIGIAILAWQGWWWPGILILVAISGVTQMIMRRQVDKEEEAVLMRASAERAKQEEHSLRASRAETLPARCPACGAPLSATTVNWRSPTTATCPYCDTGVTTK